jgi:hypothetical protein
MSFNIRMTGKLVKRVKEPLVADPKASTGLFGDWYANLVYIERQQVILAISEKTLLPLLIPAKDAKLFPRRLTESLQNSLAELTIPKEHIAKQLAEMSSWTFSKTASRQVLGVMTDFGKALNFYVGHGETLQQLQARLAETPCSLIGMDSPLEKTCKLFGVRAPCPRWVKITSHLRIVT